MEKIDRRTALMGAGTAAIALAASGPQASAQSTPPPAEGVERKTYGDNMSMIPGYKRVSLVDVIVQPGKSSGPNKMNNPMICHMLEGELEVKQDNGVFTAKKNHVWTCNTGMMEGVANKGTSVAIMRIANLLAS
jgi:hypothetical protein